jgi:hypothetical protein
MTADLGGGCEMDPIALILSLPTELELWLILGYVVVILVGARLAEALAQVHFNRAWRFAEAGFEYDAAGDHYSCPQGERLALHVLQSDSRLAVYSAPASSCNGCSFKGTCSPHDDERQLYRPLAAWTETDIGRFHRRLSMVMIGIGAVFSFGALARWIGQPGTGLLLLALSISLFCVARDLREAWAGPESEFDRAEEIASLSPSRPL